MKYSIKTIGNPLLAKRAEPVKAITDEIKDIALEMIKLMYEFNGVGIAAPQIGVSKRMVVLDLKADKTHEITSPGEALLLPQMPVILINPEILDYSREKTLFEEGCLSVPKIYAEVERSVSVILGAYLLNGEKIEIECSGMLAIVIQHELDHLDGILFVDRISASEMKKVKDKIDILKAEPIKERK